MAYHFLTWIHNTPSPLSQCTLTILLKITLLCFLPLEYKVHKSRTHIYLTDYRLLLWEIEGSVTEDARRQKRPPGSATEGGGCGALTHRLPVVMGLGLLIADTDDRFVLPCPAHRQSRTLMARAYLCQRHSTKRLGTSSW